MTVNGLIRFFEDLSLDTWANLEQLVAMRDSEQLLALFRAAELYGRADNLNFVAAALLLRHIRDWEFDGTRAEWLTGQPSLRDLLSRRKANKRTEEEVTVCSHST